MALVGLRCAQPDARSAPLPTPLLPRQSWQELFDTCRLALDERDSSPEFVINVFKECSYEWQIEDRHYRRRAHWLDAHSAFHPTGARCGGRQLARPGKPS